MKKCFLDTNLLFYYSDTGSPFYQQAASIISQLLIKDWAMFISPLTLDEYFHNMIRFSKVAKTEAFSDLKRSFNKLIKMPSLNLINPPSTLTDQRKVISLMIKYQLRARDAYHLFTMKENKIQYLVTFDDDFDQVFEKGIIRKF